MASWTIDFSFCSRGPFPPMGREVYLQFEDLEFKSQNIILMVELDQTHLKVKNEKKKKILWLATVSLGWISPLK